MKPTIFLIIFISILLPFKGSSINNKTENYVSPYSAMSIGDIVGMNAKEFSQATGQKLSIRDRIVFGLVKSQLKKGLKKGDLELNASAAEPAAKVDGSFNIGAFILGLLLGIIGFLIVLIAFKDKKAWKWSLLGWGLWILLFLVFFI